MSGKSILSLDRSIPSSESGISAKEKTGRNHSQYNGGKVLTRSAGRQSSAMKDAESPGAMTFIAGEIVPEQSLPLIVLKAGSNTVSFSIFIDKQQWDM